MRLLLVEPNRGIAPILGPLYGLSMRWRCVGLLVIVGAAGACGGGGDSR